ncbi:MAG: hypothetical protein RLZZ126_1389 [Pseudomonadota bacterium]|jgi:uncharacterized protein YgbK (DUF1537 family)
MDGLLLGCIADDFTGATDLASNLVKEGMRVQQCIGIPTHPWRGDADAIVIALKSRTAPAAQAVAESLQALDWLRGQGALQIYFKYCSTFDSTAEGNIGPVTEALMDALHGQPGAELAVATPAFPENGRTVYKGHLFVGDLPLHESGMKDHPLTPMRDSNLVRVLQAQVRRRVGLVDFSTVARGPQAIRDRLAALKAQGLGLAIVDALDNQDLMALGQALAGAPLVTAGSGLAIGLPQNFGITPSRQAALLPKPAGRQAIVSGSCSSMTNAQVAHFRRSGRPVFAIDPLALAENRPLVQEALSWAGRQEAQHPILIHATAEPESVRAVQKLLGATQAGEIVEHGLSAIAAGLVKQGVGQLVIAGGETSGACVQALGISRLQVGAAIAPGVPWCHAASALATGGHLHLALKSGNFGPEDFFSTAFAHLR